MGDIQVYKKKTILVKWNGERIAVDLPYDVVEDAVAKADTIKIGHEHTIRTSAINEYYGYNVTNELESWAEDEFRDIFPELRGRVENRIKEGMRVNKEIIANIAKSLMEEKQPWRPMTSEEIHEKFY